MVVRVSWRSFSSRVIGFLSSLQDKGVVIEQGQRVGGELIEFRIGKLQGRLGRARACELAQEVSDVLGSESASRERFFQGGGDFFRTVNPQ